MNLKRVVHESFESDLHESFESDLLESFESDLLESENDLLESLQV